MHQFALNHAGDFVAAYLKDYPGKRPHVIDVGALNVNGSLREVLPKRAILDHDENNMASNHKGVTRLAKVMGVPFQPFVFPAGSMFWFRPEALQAMCAIEAREFDIELGLSDGTFAHAVERYFALTAAFHGYQITDHTGARVRVDLAA